MTAVNSLVQPPHVCWPQPLPALPRFHLRPQKYTIQNTSNSVLLLVYGKDRKHHVHTQRLLWLKMQQRVSASPQRQTMEYGTVIVIQVSKCCIVIMLCGWAQGLWRIEPLDGTRWAPMAPHSSRKPHLFAQTPVFPPPCLPSIIVILSGKASSMCSLRQTIQQGHTQNIVCLS